MKYVVQVIIFLIVTSQYIEKSQCLRSPSRTSSNRDHGRVRPNAGGKAHANTNQKITQGPKLSSDPCTPLNATMPNYRAKHRISDAKCLEYIWGIKTEQEETERRKKCKHSNHHQIGGRDTKPGEFPHMGAVGWRANVGTWIFKCGSTLISPNFMLTAAHCSLSATDSNVANPIPEIVRLGDKNILDKFGHGKKPIDVRIRDIKVHPKFDSPKKYYDIAIIRLIDTVTFTKFVQPACLWTRANNLAAKATSTGWGVIEIASRETSPELQVTNLDVINSTLCDKLLRPSCNRLWCGMQPHQLCAGKLAGGVDACRGDSGGPLQVKLNLPFKTGISLHYIIGITSFGFKCAQENKPGVYTRVSSFVDWIESTVWGQ